MPVYDRVIQAARTEDLFDELTVVLPPRLLEKHLTPEVEKMRTQLDEGKYSSFEDKDAARLALARFEDLYKEGLSRAARGLYAPDGYTPILPQRRGHTIAVGGRVYTVGDKFHTGDHTALYHGSVNIGTGSAAVAIRLANTPSDNHHVFNEIRMLDILHRQDVGYWRNLPFMLDRFDANGRVGLILRYFDGLTLADIREDVLHRNGLDQRHVVWVMDRILGTLGYVHRIGVVHGQISPSRVRIRPYNHNAMLTGWSHAVYKPATTGERVLPLGGVFEAPEVRDSKSIGPWTDIYCLGKTLIWLIGGDPVTNEMPDSVEPKLSQFLLNMVPKNPKARPHDAWQIYEAQNRLKDSLWERQFVHLNITQRS
ncbi:MAG: serine/threonine-protein kinase [Patescibacteria group bacterium]